MVIGNERPTAKRLHEALRLIDGWVGVRGPRGVGAAVWHRGQLVAERYAGEAKPGQPVTAETIFALASVTKPVTATVVISLVEAGYFGLDEPVVAIVSEFSADPGATDHPIDPALERLRATVTPRHLLAHTSGLPEDLSPRRARDRAEETEPLGAPPTLAAITDDLLRLPLQFRPGSELRYSNAGYAVLARLVERATGEEFWDVARARVLDPLALHDTFARPGADVESRLIHLADASNVETVIETYNSAYWRALAIPWGGLYGTPRDLARFAASFLADGPRLLSAAGIRLMTSDQAGVPGGVVSARVRWETARWGLGWEIKGEKRHHWTGDLTSPATFCHFGAAGTLLWADPAAELVLAVFSNRAVANMWNFILSRWARLSNAVVAAATAEEPPT